MRWCVLAAVAVSLLSRSVPVQPAQAENHAPTKDGTFSQKLRGTDVRPEVATPVGKARDLMSPKVADEESAHAKTTQGRNRRSAAQWRPSSSLFSQQLGTGSKLLVALSLLAGTAFMLKGVGGALWKCLAELGGSEPRDGSTPRSLSSLPSSGACERLLGQIAESYGGDDVGSESRSASSALRLSAGMPNLMLVSIVLFAIIAISLAGSPTAHTEAEEPEMLLRGSGEEGDNGSDDVEEMDDTPAPVEVKGKYVTIGKGWQTRKGISKQGKRIVFDYEGKHYTVYFSKLIETALGKKLLHGVSKVLKKGPTMAEGLIVWGKKNSRTVLAYESEFETAEEKARVLVHLPAGVFGLVGESDMLTNDIYAEGYFDLWEVVYALTYVMVTGEKPPPLEE